MRISDLSSDVCSSDLLRQFQRQCRRAGAVAAAEQRHLARVALARQLLGGLQHFGQMQHPRGAVDRKSVVSGKSESVSVDLGGRCLNKKNTNNKQQLTATTPQSLQRL